MKRSLFFLYAVVLSFFVSASFAPRLAFADDDEDLTDVDEMSAFDEDFDDMGEDPSCKDAVKSFQSEHGGVDAMKSQHEACKALRNCKQECRKAKRGAKKEARETKRDCKADCKSKKGKEKRECKAECRKAKRSESREANGAKLACVKKCRSENLSGPCKEARNGFGKALGGWVKSLVKNKDCQGKAKELFSQFKDAIGS